MSQTDHPNTLLNIFEIEDDTKRRFLLCFLDPVLAGARGIDPRSIVGEFAAPPGVEPNSFAANPGFSDSLCAFMNAEAASSLDISSEARNHPGGQLFVLDPRAGALQGEQEPNVSDVIGWFQVDEAGVLVQNSFEYNSMHLWINPTNGPSGVLSDRRFHDWLHAIDPR